MPPLKLARNAALLATLAALAVLLGTFAALRPLVIAAAVIAAAAGAVATVSLARTPAEPRPGAEVTPTSTADPNPAPRKPKEATVLLATLRNMSGSDRLAGDLHRILAGIVADERGSIDSSEDQGLVASFLRNEHATSAVHAAQRMLSNVDALSRRLGQDFRIAIGVHSGPKGSETLDVASRVRDASTDSVPVLVSGSAARHLGNQLEKVDTVRGEGWSLDVFTFPPAQKRLPGL
jgi:class 3 adenylate cyclase